MKIAKCCLVAAFSMLADGQAPLRAEDAPAKKWKDKAELSVVSTNGNSKATSTSAKNIFNYQWTQTMLEVTAGALGTESEGRVTAEQYDAGEKATWNFSKLNYLYERFGWDKNRFAGIRNRYDLSGGLGRELLNFPKDKLIAELGAGYINEERTDSPRNDFASGRGFAKYDRVITETASFSQDFEYLANFEDNEDYRLKTETALVASISTHVSLKASYVWKRLNKPARGFGKDDTLTAVALIVNY